MEAVKEPGLLKYFWFVLLLLFFLNAADTLLGPQLTAFDHCAPS